MGQRSIKHLAPAPRRPMHDHPAANNAFIGVCADFDDLVSKLQAARAANFGIDPERGRNWAEACFVAHANQTLASALAFLTCSAE